MKMHQEEWRAELQHFPLLRFILSLLLVQSETSVHPVVPHYNPKPLLGCAALSVHRFSLLSGMYCLMRQELKNEERVYLCCYMVMSISGKIKFRAPVPIGWYECVNS